MRELADIRIAIHCDDPAATEELRTALTGAELVDLADAEVVVLDADPARSALPSSLDAACRIILRLRPIGVVRRAPPTPWWDNEPWYGRAVIEHPVDALIYGNGNVADGVRWAAGEDRSSRTSGSPRLTCLGGLAHGASFPIPLGKTVHLGRTGHSNGAGPHDIHVPTGMVARRHASLEHDDRGVWLRDLGSTNGTLLIGRNRRARLLGARIADRGGAPTWIERVLGDEPAALAPGDELVLPGWAHFRLDGQ